MNDSVDFCDRPPIFATPLCRRYFGVAMNKVELWVSDARECHTVVVWAQGFGSSCDPELLGLWLSTPDVSDWSSVHDDLGHRGVELVRFVLDGIGVADDPSRVIVAGAAAIPSLQHLLSQGLAQVSAFDKPPLSKVLEAVCTAATSSAAVAALDDLTEIQFGLRYPKVVDQWRAALNRLGPYFALGPRQRRLIRRGDVMSQALQEGVKRSVARHGTFADEAAGLRFVKEALRRAERRLGGLMVRDRLASVGARARPTCIAGPALAMI